MIRFRLSSTLFPYTTLFRSAGLAAAVDSCSITPEALTSYLRGRLLASPEVVVEQLSVVPGGRSKETILATLSGTAEDRKSTRLNSSHRCISYAVFCLKKKTK